VGRQRSADAGGIHKEYISRIEIYLTEITIRIRGALMRPVCRTAEGVKKCGKNHRNDRFGRKNF